MVRDMKRPMTLSVGLCLLTGCATTPPLEPVALWDSLPAPVEPAPEPKPVQTRLWADVLDVGRAELTAYNAVRPSVLATIEVRPMPAQVTDHYVVEPGDTLFAIARRELGDGQRWRELVQLNPGLDPAGLTVGQVLQIP